MFLKRILLIIVLLCVSTALNGQTDTSIVKLKAFEITTADIPRRLEETNSYLKSVNNLIDNNASVKSLDGELIDFINEMDSNKTVFNDVELNDLSLRRLEDLSINWKLYETKVIQWQNLFENNVLNLEEEKNNLANLKRIWDNTANAARKDRLPKSIRNEIEEIRSAITLNLNKIQKRINYLISSRTKLSTFDTILSEVFLAIDKSLENRRQQYYSLDSKPLWIAYQDSTLEKSLSEQLQSSFAIIEKDLIGFYDNYPEKVFIVLFAFFLFLVFSFSIKQYYSKIDGEKDELWLTSKFMDHPVSLSILIISVFTLLYFEDLSSIVLALILMFIAAPMVIILKEIVAPENKKHIYIIVILLFFNEFYLLALENSLLQRSLLLLLSILTTAYSSRIFFNNIKPIKDRNIKYYRIVRLFTIVTFTFTSLSIILNIIGNVTLAELLTNGTLLSIYLAMLLFAVVKATYSLILLSLHTRYMMQFNVVKKEFEKISLFLEKLLGLVSKLLWVYGVLEIFKISKNIYGILNDFLDISILLDSAHITIGDLLTFLLTIYISIKISQFVKFVFEGDLLPRMNFKRGVASSIATITTYSIVSLGFLIALFAIGLDLTKFTVLAGAFGVGIGFGMQNIVNNFISGLILLFERPIQTGDTITIDNTIGKVKRIGIRSSTIRDYDGAEIIVPNADLISNKVTNWTLSDKLRRIQIGVGVAYGSDANKVIDILMDSITEMEEVLSLPKPYVLFTEFGASSLDFELRFWVSNFDDWLEIQSEVRLTILNSLNEAGIVIPFPQRDLHIISDATKENK